MHMHTAQGGDPRASVPAVSSPSTSTSFSEEVLARLDRLPPFGRRVLKVPFRLNHPVWVADRPIDPRRHIVHQALPQPGGMEGARGARRPDHQRPAGPQRPALGAAPGRGARGRPGRGRRQAAPRAGRRQRRQQPARQRQPERAARPAARTRLEPTPTRPRLVGGAGRRDQAARSRCPAAPADGANVPALVQIRRGSDVTPPRPLLDVPRTSFNARPRPAPQLRDLHAPARRAQGA